MAWINNAGAIASLIATIFAIGGYIVGIVTYLRKKVSPKQPADLISQDPLQVQKPSVPPKPISGVDWIGIFGQGFIDGIDVIINRFSLQEEFDESIDFARWVIVSGGGCMVLI